MYDAILVPTDESDTATLAAEHALDVAGRYDATIHALSVVDLGGITGVPTVDIDATGIEDRLTEAAMEATEAIADRAAEAGIDCVTTVRTGTPYREILAYVDEEPVDLVVMGTHGRSGLERLLMGSVAEHVVRASPVPVLTVRAGDD